MSVQSDRALALPEIPAARQAQIDAAVVTIRATDPGFDIDKLREQATSEFLLVKRARADRDVEPLREHVSDGCLQAWLTQARAQRDSFVAPHQDGLFVRDCAVLGIARVDRLDQVLVGFQYRSATYALYEPTGSILFGDREPREFLEYWVLIRPVDSVTPGFKRSCACCGAPIPVPASAICRYCRTPLGSLVPGWTLANAGDELDWKGFSSPGPAAH